jgi:hypothetical protein
MSEFCFERSFPLVSLLDPYIIVSLAYVHFQKDVGTAQIGYECHGRVVLFGFLS